MPLTAGTRLGSYEIVAPLGAGGMGEVYRATDTKLGRDVALKVLPAEMARDAERLARFRREAKTLAQLDHPNIVTIYSVEECDGVHFLTMQLVEGQPLDRLIPGSGLPVEQIVEIAGALGDALAAAHEKGIVHRDLKPANVMVSNEGRVKVLDFGLAKDVRGANVGDATLTSSQTQVGVVMGTPAYMSPEQTSGRPLDHRTDIFSLGVVLHEMATGQRPFSGGSSAELVSAILRDTPPLVTDLRPELPSDLARIVRRCLEKDPRHRVQTARDVSNEFRDLARQASKEAVTATPQAPRALVATDSGAARADEGFWVAVLPFRYGGGNADLKALAGGLTDDIVTGMLRFSYLRVIARGSTAKYSSESGDVRAIGKELGARYVMEGNLRQAGAKLRLAVQLVDAVSGAHLWAENYERTFSPENIFALQDDLVPRIVSTVADWYGILPHNICDALRRKADDQLSPHEAVLRAFSYFERIASPEEHAQVRQILERAVRSAPDQGEIWAMLSTLYWHEHAVGFNPQPNPLGRALAAARRSVDAAPTNNLGHSALAATLFFQKNILAFRPAAERAIELNPMDGSNLAMMGILMAYSGDWEHGCALVESALQLNPHHPGWYWFAHFLDAYRKSDYRGALSLALKFNMPGYFYSHALTAAVYGQLGMREPAQKALQELLAIRPDFAVSARTEFEKFYDSELVEQLIDGIRKAGLEIEGKASSSVATKTTDSGASRADEGFWVAVLPFKYAGTSAELKALADGLSEEIVTGLSRFSYLRVIARSSTTRYAIESVDIRSAGKELGARYVMEGTLRQAGTKLRVAVQLVDAVSGAHLWAENYERSFVPEAVFDVQDDLVPRIVSTVADQHGILPRGISEELRSKNEEDLTPHEAVLRSFSFIQRISPTEHATARRILERAVEQDPNQADAWAMLAFMYDTEFADEYNPRPNPLERAMAAAQRAVDLAPTHALGYYALAFTYFFRKDNAGFRAAVEQAIALNPMDGSVMGLLGLLVHHVGEIKRGTQMVEAAMQLNPHYPPVFRAPAFLNAYAQGKYAEALELAVRFNMPGFFHAHALRAAALGQLGQREAGQQAVQELLAVRPDFATTARRDYGKWWDAKTVDHLIDGLRKAGLEIAPEKEGEAPALPLARSSSSDSRTLRTEESSPSAEGVTEIKRHRIALAIAVILLVIGVAGIVAYPKTSKTGQIDSIAVLPLENRSNDPDSDYIPDGITESINNSLARLPSLTVIPHSVAFHYKGKAMDVRKVGDELHVQAVLAGSVAQRGDDLTIDVELDDVRNGKQLWGEQYHRKLADLLAVQSDIAREVSQRLHSQLSADDQKKLTKGSTSNPEAYRLYLKGKFYTDKFTKEGFETGIDYFNQAIAVDPNYGLAYSGLAYNYINQDDWFMAPNEAGPKTKGAAEKALAIDESDARARLTLAIEAHWYEWKWAAAENEFKRTIELSPNNTEAHTFYAWFLSPMGRNDEALAEAKRAQQADPLSPFASFSLGGTLVFARQWEPAIEQLRRAIELDPNFWFSHCFLGRAYEQRRRFPEAIAEFQRALEIEKDNSEIWSGLGHAYASSGNRAEAQKVLDHLKDLSAHGWVAPYNVAVIYAGLGEKDQAFTLLERAYKDRSYYMATYLATDERLDNLRSDPRFAELRRRVGLPE